MEWADFELTPKRSSLTGSSGGLDVYSAVISKVLVAADVELPSSG